MKIVVAVNSDSKTTPFTDHLEKYVEVHHVAPSYDALRKMVDTENIDAIIGSVENLELIKTLIIEFPMINYALLSSESADDFHEMTEGYGIFMQLPPAPQAEDAQKLLEILQTITLAATGSPKAGDKL